MIAGMSQDALAKATGTYSTLISRYERGLTVPSLLMAMDMAKALDLTLDEYVGLRPLPEKWIEDRALDANYE